MEHCSSASQQHTAILSLLQLVTWMGYEPATFKSCKIGYHRTVEQGQIKIKLLKRKYKDIVDRERRSSTVNKPDKKKPWPSLKNSLYLQEDSCWWWGWPTKKKRSKSSKMQRAERAENVMVQELFAAHEEARKERMKCEKRGMKLRTKGTRQPQPMTGNWCCPSWGRW